MSKADQKKIKRQSTKESHSTYSKYKSTMQKGQMIGILP